MADFLTPMRAIRKTCLYCAVTPSRVKDCDVERCPLHPLRFGRRMNGVSPLKSIRKRCVWCMSGQVGSIRNCPETECPSWPYRFGKRPKK